MAWISDESGGNVIFEDCLRDKYSEFGGWLNQSKSPINTSFISQHLCTLQHFSPLDTERKAFFHNFVSDEWFYTKTSVRKSFMPHFYFIGFFWCVVDGVFCLFGFFQAENRICVMHPCIYFHCPFCFTFWTLIQDFSSPQKNAQTSSILQ